MPKPLDYRPPGAPQPPDDIEREPPQYWVFLVVAGAMVGIMMLSFWWFVARH